MLDVCVHILKACVDILRGFPTYFLTKKSLKLNIHKIGPYINLEPLCDIIIGESLIMCSNTKVV